MDFEKLESFIVLANVKNFTKAADQLFISQPALSKQIQSLENELNVPLFDRVGKQTFLTIQGRYFKNYAEEMLATYLSSIEHIRQIENLEEGTVNFGATNFIGVYLMPSVIARFHQKYPDIRINMTINSSKNILDLLHKNQLEFVFLSDYIVGNDDRYIVENYMEDELKLIVGNKHHLFEKSECSLLDLEYELFITKSETSSQSNFLTKKFEEAGFFISNTLLISNQEAIKESVINNIGISFISTKAVEREVKYGLLKCLDLKEMKLKRNIQYVYEKSRHLTPAAREFLSMLKE